MKIVSASRREDMPAFRMSYLMEKYVSMGDDCFWVLWTKNPENMVGAPLDYSRTALQLTVTGLGGSDLEPGVPTPESVWDSTERLVAAGFDPRLINWRFDPVIPTVSSPRALKYGAGRARALGIGRCTISFVYWYGHVKARWPEGSKTVVSTEAQRKIALQIRDILDPYGITLYGCAQPALNGVVVPSSCIDGNYYAQVTGQSFATGKDPSQRAACGCTPSVDIGSYRPCPHRCVYCYSKGR